MSSDRARLATDYHAGLLSKDLPHERDRLGLLEQWGDPESQAVLAQCGLSATSRCLEIGAGAGSIARWLAQQCPDGRVIAVDSDARYLDGPVQPALEWRQEDIGTLEFADDSFDLIHSRLTFCHLGNRREMIDRAFRWLRPGGWLAICDPMLMPAASSADPDVRRFFAAMEQAWTAQGSDMADWARALPTRMAEAGLKDMSVRARANVIGDGGVYDHLAASNIEQEGGYMVERGLVPADVRDRVLALVRSSRLVELRSITLYAWGRKPLPAGSGTPES
ncbi:MAG: methyltransferase domain-containing protein [Jatrophihabitantaceae bacterium]